MKVLRSLVFVSCWLLVFGKGQYYPLKEGGIRATVQHIRSDHVLSERSARNLEDVFKEVMTFTITLEDGPTIELVLERNDRHTPHVLVKVASDSGTEMINLDKPKDYRFYQVLGDDHGAAVMVRCPDFQEPCHVAGNFFYQDNEYIIDPDTGVANLAENLPHTVHKVDSAGHNYGDDVATAVVNSTETDEPEMRSKNLELMSKLMSLLNKEGIYQRQTSTRSFKIELEMVVCDDVFKFWMNMLGQNRDAAIQKIVEYYEQVANNMDLRFSTASSSTMDIDIVPYLINIRETANQCPWVNQNIVGTNDQGNKAYNVDKALDEFEAWGMINKNTNADAIMLFSSQDMWSDGIYDGRFTSGLARSISDWSGNPLTTTCRRDFIAVSISEDLLSGDTSSTAAHELAHNLGVDHDSNIAGCLKSQSFIMSPESGFLTTADDAKNPWTFSPCSVETMVKTLTRLSENSCLERSSYNPIDYNRVLTSDLLGEIYQKDQQCALFVGPGSIYCAGSWTGVAPDEICWGGVPCSTSVRNGQCASATFIHAAAGTNCGGTKQCYQGQCIESANIPPPDTEPVSGVQTTSTTTKSTTTPTTTKPTTSSTTTKPTTTTKTTTKSTTKTTTTTTTSRPTTTNSETTTEMQFTPEELEYLWSVYNRCKVSCRCWKRQCKTNGRTALCRRFAPDCY